LGIGGHQFLKEIQLAEYFCNSKLTGLVVCFFPRFVTGPIFVFSSVVQMSCPDRVVAQQNNVQALSRVVAMSMLVCVLTGLPV
jgi:hypothetical protein